MTQEKKIKEANMSLTLELLEFFKKFRDEAVASHTQKIVEMCEGKRKYYPKYIVDELIEGIKSLQKQSVTFCPSCNCVTHTVEGKCGKCGVPKQSADEKLHKLLKKV